ncbi:MAG: M20/M25/M40 family metallo-hydrolase [Anaerolineaceae bacterium]|nr:M20/M25/M40 family metallo-hydrolase [Anaerolineaceae bacterium]
MNEINTFLKELISAPGISGYETPVRKIIEEKWESLTDEMQVSKIGSLEGLKKGTGEGKRPSILLAGHMDAIGLMVTHVIEGFIGFTSIGGVDPRVILGQPVEVHGRELLNGIIVQPSDHLLPENIAGKPVPLEYLFIDVGLPPEKVDSMVRTGDAVSFAQPPVELGEKVIAGHTMDDRAAVVAITHCLEILQTRLHKWDVWAVATVQEEVGLKGALTSTFGLDPDIGVAIDVTHAKGPGTTESQIATLDKGLVLDWGPNVHPFIYNKFKEIADDLEIPYQTGYHTDQSGTDTYAIQITAGGKPTMLLSIPLRYMHTPVEVVSVKDIQRTGRLLAEFISSLDDDFINSISWED